MTNDGQTVQPVFDKPTPARTTRGFAAMSREKQREIASLGGKAAHASGHAHEFTSEEARAAGRKRHEKSAKPQLQ